jgi:pimeloyl-ACP methyl ester carboxylesterase
MITKIKRWLARLGILILIILVVAVGGFVVWASTPLGPDEAALTALQSGDGIQVEDTPWLSFRPSGAEPATGLILYPGGRVDARAYAPLARAIAGAGHRVVIVPMPLNLAVFGPARAGDVIAAYPAVEVWAIGGHSLGGAMAANYVYNHPGAVKGLVLWAAYPAGGDDLSGREALTVLSIYGTRDGLLTDEEVAASRERLPPATCWVAIEGGNHAQFGAYGTQRGDKSATISAAQQHARIVEATTTLIEALSSGDGAPHICTALGGTP